MVTDNKCVFIKEAEGYISPKGYRKSRGLYRCFCGNEFIAINCNIKSGAVKCCGCIKKNMLKDTYTTHGMSKTSIYYAYMNMISRCYNPKHASYKNYGAKGIIVCDRWRDGFEFFYEDMSPSHIEGLTLERNESNGAYSKDNCRWATWKEQSTNKSNSRLITFNGETMCIKDWSRKLNGSNGIVSSRINNGWSISDALTIPPYRKIPLK